MTTHYEYINFMQLPNPGKKSQIWKCDNNKSAALLGLVRWNVWWRQYCFYPEPSTVFSSGCLDDIINFIKQLKENHD